KQPRVAAGRRGGGAAPAERDTGATETRARGQARSPRGTGGGRPPPTQPTHPPPPPPPPLERQICPAVRAGPRNEGRRQTVNAFLYVARMAAQGSLSSGKGNLRRRPPARRSSSTRTLEIVL